MHNPKIIINFDQIDCTIRIFFISKSNLKNTCTKSFQRLCRLWQVSFRSKGESICNLISGRLRKALKFFTGGFNPRNFFLCFSNHKGTMTDLSSLVKHFLFSCCRNDMNLYNPCYASGSVANKWNSMINTRVARAPLFAPLVNIFPSFTYFSKNLLLNSMNT